ncbi:MAG: hypothetical protein AB1540_14520 [Bdellovibrionota bacterium]
MAGARGYFFLSILFVGFAFASPPWRASGAYASSHCVDLLLNEVLGTHSLGFDPATTEVIRAYNLAVTYSANKPRANTPAQAIKAYLKVRRHLEAAKLLLPENVHLQKATIELEPISTMIALYHELRGPRDKYDNVAAELRVYARDLKSYLADQALALETARSFDQAVWLYSLMRESPKKAETHLYLADRYEKMGRLQESAWLFRRAGEYARAEALEATIEEVLREAPIRSKRPMAGKGVFSRSATHPYLVDLEGGITAVVRVEKDHFASNIDHEVGAFHLDRALALDVVPVTVIREIEGARCSLQYFFKDAPVAALLNHHSSNFKIRLLNDLLERFDTHATNAVVLPLDLQATFDFGYLAEASNAFVYAPPLSPRLHFDAVRVTSSIRDADVEKIRTQLGDSFGEARLNHVLRKIELLKAELSP